MTIAHRKRRLAKLAGTIHATLARPRLASTSWDIPEAPCGRVRRLLGRLQTAQRRGWREAEERLRSSLLPQLDELQREWAELTRRLQTPPSTTVVAARDIYEDLLALDDEFAGKIVFARRRCLLSVDTEPVELEGRHLGAFRITLDWSAMSDSRPYTVVALDPRPAACDPETTHPHVQGKHLCEGDGSGAVRAALRGGRLLDFFQIVDRILHSYNPESPYVSLDRWDGVVCQDCDAALDGEQDNDGCTACGRDLCCECAYHCGECRVSLCSGCATACQLCDDPLCADCAGRCRQCGRTCCSPCLNNERCQDCHDEAEDVRQEPDAAVHAV